LLLVFAFINTNHAVLTLKYCLVIHFRHWVRGLFVQHKVRKMELWV